MTSYRLLLDGSLEESKCLGMTSAGFYLGLAMSLALCSPHSRMTLKPESYTCIKALSPDSTQGAVLTFHLYPGQRRDDKGCSEGKPKTQDDGCPLLASSVLFLRSSSEYLFHSPCPFLHCLSIPPCGTEALSPHVSPWVLWAPLVPSHSQDHSRHCFVCRDGFEVILSSWFRFRHIT